MIASYFIAFFTLIFVSFAFSIYRKVTKSKNVFIHALSFVPIACSLMSVVCIVGLAIVLSFFMCLSDVFGDYINKGGFFDDLFIPFMLLSFLAVPIILLIFCIFILRFFARQNLRKFIYTAYAIVFFASGLFGAGLCAYAVYFPLWQKVQVEDFFSYESQVMPNNILENPRYNFRISFKSAKIINLENDFWRSRNYTLYQLENGDIFMKPELKYRASYIVSLEEEEIYLYRKGYKYKLNGKAIELWTAGDAKVDVEKGYVQFFTYERYLRNNSDSYLAKGIECENLESLSDLKALGLLSIESFDGSVEDYKQ